MWLISPPQIGPGILYLHRIAPPPRPSILSPTSFCQFSSNSFSPFSKIRYVHKILFTFQTYPRRSFWKVLSSDSCPVASRKCLCDHTEKTTLGGTCVFQYSCSRKPQNRMIMLWSRLICACVSWHAQMLFFFFFFISPSFSFPFCFSEGTFDLGFKEVPVKIPGNAKPVSPLTFKNKTREQCYKVDTKDSDILRTIFFTGRRLLYQEHQEPKDLNSSPSFFQLYLWHWPVLLSESQFLYLHSCIVRFSEDQVKMCANMFLNP